MADGGSTRNITAATLKGTRYFGGSAHMSCQMVELNRDGMAAYSCRDEGEVSAVCYLDIVVLLIFPHLFLPERCSAFLLLAATSVSIERSHSTSHYSSGLSRPSIAFYNTFFDC